MSILKKATTAIAATLVAAYGIGQFTSKSLYTEIEISAPASAVWAELANTEKYPEWNPFVKRLSGELAVGNRLAVTIQSEGNAAMDFSPTVLVSDENHELRWVGQLGFSGIFDGEHFFIMDETPEGTTLFRQGEHFSGMLSYVLFPFIEEDTENGFEAMNAALKARVEASD